jgi:hypothetical protein
VNEQLVLFVVGQLVTAAGVYGAIRADLREALTRCALLERRLDRLEEHAK